MRSARRARPSPARSRSATSAARAVRSRRAGARRAWRAGRRARSSISVTTASSESSTARQRALEGNWRGARDLDHALDPRVVRDEHRGRPRLGAPRRLEEHAEDVDSMNGTSSRSTMISRAPSSASPSSSRRARRAVDVGFAPRRRRRPRRARPSAELDRLQRSTWSPRAPRPGAYGVRFGFAHTATSL